ncbi:EAL domain-containing protein, partial [Treponema sp.]|uniref:EAL domain-containing protein n=1 Tax=Treponema sp. TaxID=166 RepID=UPI00388E9888
FDLIKFDMSFMRQFNEKNKGKVILAELMKMPFSIGADTVCEGVETEEQIQFLREIGCSKIQGFYYGKPIPFTEVLSKINDPNSLGFENPEETQYFETIGRVNLHDLAVITYENEQDFNNIFNMIPMAILEVSKDVVRFVRTNQSYRNFFKRFFGVAVTDKEVPISLVLQSGGSSFMRVVQKVAEDGKRTFVDESLPDGSIANYFIRKLSENPVTKKVSVAVGVLMIMDADQGTTYANIAKALSADYFRLFYVNTETDQFTEYSSIAGEELLSTERHGEKCFETEFKAILKIIYPEDLENFKTVFTKENIINELNENGKFSLSFRMVKEGVPVYINMKIMQMNKTNIIIALSNIDAQVKQKNLLEKAKQDETIFNRLMALSGDFVCMYIVNPKTEEFTEYNASKDYEKLGIEKQGKDFFALSRKNAEKSFIPEDVKKFQNDFVKEKILKEIEENGIFARKYKLIIAGEVKQSSTRAALVKENGEDKLIVGIRI